MSRFRLSSTFLSVCVVLLGVTSSTLQARPPAPVAAISDSEWPPEADPDSAGEDPSNLDLLMSSIHVTISDDCPDYFRSWMKHKNHNGDSGAYPMWLTVGDVRGPDDGEKHVLMYMAETLLVAFELNLTVVDGQPTAGTLDPMWVWRSVKEVEPEPPDGRTQGPDPEFGHRRNVLIWDFNGDGYNEVAFVDKDPANTDQDTVFIVGYPEDDQADSPWGFSKPAPDILAQHPSTGDRLGICRVTDDPSPRDLWAFSDQGSDFQVFDVTFTSNPDTFGLQLVGYANENTHGAARVHIFNCADVDGDGFDEFMHDGVVDFVDADVNGLAVPTNTSNPLDGEQIWRSGFDGQAENHMDFMMAADFDPTNPGLEIHALPSFQDFIHPPDQSLHHGWDLYYTPQGAIIRENVDGPIKSLQNAAIGNWTDSSPGLECIYLSKDPVNDSETFPRVGSYAADALQTPLAMDGAMFFQEPDPRPGLRAGGPADIYDAIDWDGDRTTDEILCDSFRTLIVWRMGEKGDWGPVYPDWLPTQQDLTTGWTEDLQTWYWYYYQDDPSWQFNEGGPGRFSHYYEKLGESGIGTLAFVTAYDLTGDYREEILVPSNAGLYIYFNDDPLPNPWKHPSPTESAAYRQFRMERVPSPLVYADLPRLLRVELSPPTFGLHPDETAHLTATAVYSDGKTLDVTGDVSWSSDAELFARVDDVNDGQQEKGKVTAVDDGSARITAVLGDMASEPSYVYVSTGEAPAVLMAGYGDSYLDRPSPPDPLATYAPLLIQARVAQASNLPVLVKVFHPNGDPLMDGMDPVRLRDSGSSAHGDAVANDGIYSALYPNAAMRFSPGDQLLTIRPEVSGAVGEVWPYLTVGPNYTSGIDIAGQYNNNAQGDAFTPRIASAGLRGIDPNFLTAAWIEAEVIEPSAPGTAIVAVKALMPNGTVTDLMDRGDGNWVGVGLLPGTPNGTYVFHVFAIAADGQGNTYESDYWPRLRVH